MPGDNTPKTAPFHPAFSVSNIKNHVQITLEMENVHYASWAELFLNTAQAFDVADHIVPPKGAAVNKDAQWTRLDAIVKQWIYSTISIDLLHTILKPGATAKEAWDRLEDIFNDNKSSRAVFLEQQFSQIHMDNYPNASSYCQALKMLADQLANVGAPVSEERLVLRLVNGLSGSYDNLATIIQQKDPLPLFYQARSKVTLEEARRNKNSASDSALLTTHHDDRTDQNSRPPDSSSNRNNQNNRNKGGRGKNYRGKGNGGGGASNKASDNSKNNNSGQQQTQGTRPASWTWVPLTPPPWQQQQAWGAAPCPYPTTGWAPSSNRGQGILGPRPQAFIAQGPMIGASHGALVPTDLAASMQTMTLQQPDDNWYLDTGASSHVTSNEGFADGEANTETQ